MPSSAMHGGVDFHFGMEILIWRKNCLNLRRGALRLMKELEPHSGHL